MSGDTEQADLMKEMSEHMLSILKDNSTELVQEKLDRTRSFISSGKVTEIEAYGLNSICLVLVAELQNRFYISCGYTFTNPEVHIVPG